VTAVARAVLALDSSTRGGSVAVGVDGEVVAERVLEATTGASSLLMPAVDDAVRAAGLGPRDLAAVVVGGGPGAFTGLRIAAATAKALVRALGVPLFAYSGLMASAAALRQALPAAGVAEGGESPAAGLLWLARTIPGRGRVAEPPGWEPEYLRASGAERIAAAKAG